MHRLPLCRRSLLNRISRESWSPIRVLRPCRVVLRYLNEDLLREDFPRLRGLSREQLVQYVRQHLARVSQFVNANSYIEHSPVAVDETDSREGIVFKGGGRAINFWDPGSEVLIDLKGTGPTYVYSDPRGRVSVRQPDPLPRRFELHLDGCFSLSSAVHEALMGELLQSQVAEPGELFGANRAYFIFELDGKIYRPNGKDRRRFRTERAALIGRQANLRLHMLDLSAIEQVRRSFLYMNAKLYWKGLFHGSMNRYNAADGPRYADLETASGIPADYYRLTAQVGIGFGVWGLSHFYGLFGEWSSGQVASPEKARLSPFMSRSWCLFLANIGVLLGMGRDSVWELALLESELGEMDLHEILAAVNASRELTFVADKSNQTFTRLDWVVLDDPQDKVPGGLLDCGHVFELYAAVIRALCSRSQMSVSRYRILIESLSSEGNGEGIQLLAEAMVRLESRLRRFLLKHKGDFAQALVWLERRDRSLVLHRRNLVKDSKELVSRLAPFRSEFPLSSYLRKYQFAVDAFTGSDTLGAESDLRCTPSVLPGEFDRQWAGKEFDQLGGDKSARGHLVRIPRDQVYVPWVRQYCVSTVGFIWHDTRTLGALERWGHGFIRIGDWLVDAKLHGLDQCSFSTFVERFSRGALLYEATFRLSSPAWQSLQEYFRARIERRATIYGSVCEPQFSFVGSGYSKEDGQRLEENCSVFALSFLMPEWQVDYPGLRQVSLETGIGRDLLTCRRLGPDLFSSEKTRPFSCTIWGGKGERLARWDQGSLALCKTVIDRVDSNPQPVGRS